MSFDRAFLEELAKAFQGDLIGELAAELLTYRTKADEQIGNWTTQIYFQAGGTGGVVDQRTYAFDTDNQIQVVRPLLNGEPPPGMFPTHRLDPRVEDRPLPPMTNAPGPNEQIDPRDQAINAAREAREIMIEGRFDPVTIPDKEALDQILNDTNPPPEPPQAMPPPVVLDTIAGVPLPTPPPPLDIDLDLDLTPPEPPLMNYNITQHPGHPTPPQLPPGAHVQ